MMTFYKHFTSLPFRQDVHIDINNKCISQDTGSYNFQPQSLIKFLSHSLTLRFFFLISSLEGNKHILSR